jgi:hypothetical protein
MDTVGSFNAEMSAEFSKRLWEKLKKLELVQVSGYHKGYLIGERLEMAIRHGHLSYNVFS